uniref:Uncharacterized protein n=1 Tax=Anguilla anguilla TaxID=7936 RepID=A0A0E9QT69_ANGAN
MYRTQFSSRFVIYAVLYVKCILIVALCVK